MNLNCPICKGQDYTDHGSPYALIDISQNECKSCGLFSLTHQAWIYLQSLSDNLRIKVSVFTRERTIQNLPVIVLTVDPAKGDLTQFPTMTIDQIIDSFPRLITDRINKALLNISRMSKSIGDIVFIEPHDYPIFYPDSPGTNGVLFILKHLRKLGFIEGSGGIPSTYQVTVEGWNRIIELETTNSDSKQGFIAMSFHPSLDNVWRNGLAAAIRDAGFEPHRVSESETNGKICDEIIVQIRKSKFVVADFTGQRNGVYFEAGYALGIGIPVIWTCKKEEVDAGLLHFDTRQYNHIGWESEDDLYKRLLNRIKANII